MSTLGTLRLDDSAGRELLPGRRKELALLAFLARRAPRAVSREELAALLWGERDSSKARQSLRHALLQLRRALGEAIAVSPEDARVDPSLLELDVSAFEREIAERQLRNAVARWRGDFLCRAEDAGGEAFRAWVDAEREGLRRRLSAALDRLVTDALAGGRWDQGVAWSAQWAAALPLDEAAHRRMIDALNAAGRQDEALACHTTFVARTRRELDQDPSPTFMSIAAALTKSARKTRPSGPGSAALLTPDMVGRDAVLAELIAAWYDARAGRPAAVVFTGEEGLGKSRLCQEFVRWVKEDDTESCVLIGHASDAARATPWAASAQLLARLVDAPGLLGAAAPALRTVGRIVPALRGVLSGSAADPDLPDPADVTSAVAEVLEAVAAEVPVLLVLDDLPSADAKTQQLFAALVERSPASVMLLATARPDALAASPVAGALRQRRSLRRLQLQPLRLEETEALVGSMVALPPDDRRRLAARLYAETAGNPFYITELVFALADDGTLTLERDGRWRVDGALIERGLPLPSGVREAIERRLSALGDEARRCLEASAVATSPLGIAELTRATELPPDRVAAALNQLLARRMLREVPAGDDQTGSYEVAHDAVRRVAREFPDSARTAVAASLAPVQDGLRLRSLKWRGIAVVGGALALGLVLGLGVRSRNGVPDDGRPTIAIVGVEVARGDTGIAWLAEGLPQMIAAKLGRNADVEIVPAARVRAVRVRAGYGEDDVLPTPQLLDVARRLRATVAVSGTLTRDADVGLVLNLTAHDVSTGKLLRSDVLVRRGPLELADQSAVHLLEAGGAADENGRGLQLADLETSSLAAYQHYVRSVRLGLEGYGGESLRELDAAIALDSGFVAAVQWRLLLAMSSSDYPAMERLTRTLDRFGTRATGFDRLLWATNEALWHGDVERSEALVRQLVRRYPRDPRAHALAVNIYGHHGRWEAAEAAVTAALTLDSLGIEAGKGPCTPCLGYDNLARIRLARGDWAGAERAVRRWIALQPELPSAWLRFATTLAYTRRYDEALNAMRRSVALSGSDAAMLDQLARMLIMARRLDEADSLAAAWRVGGQPNLRRYALDLQVMLDRERGQLRASTRSVTRAIALDSLLGFLDLIRYNSLARLGEYAAVERLHERRIHGSPARPVHPWPPTTGNARGFCWEHALLADAIAPAGDTARLLAIADSLERGCARSYYARDWTLHHHVRGLVHAVTGRYADAVREFRRVPHTVAEAWSRTAVELARAQLALGRPHDAVATIRLAYATPVDAMGRYVARSELDYHMARAFAAAGLPDSAARYAAYVRRAWANADRELLTRYPLSAIP